MAYFAYDMPFRKNGISERDNRRDFLKKKSRRIFPEIELGISKKLKKVSAVDSQYALICSSYTFYILK